MVEKLVYMLVDVKVVMSAGRKVGEMVTKSAATRAG